MYVSGGRGVPRSEMATIRPSGCVVGNPIDSRPAQDRSEVTALVSLISARRVPTREFIRERLATQAKLILRPSSIQASGSVCW